MYMNWNNDNKNHTSDIHFLTRLNIALTSDHNYRSNMDKALNMIGNYYGNDRIHILKIYPDRTFTILYEWCRKTVPPVKDKSQKHPCFYESLLEQQLNTQNYILIEKPENLNCPELKNYLKECNTEHSILLPLFSRYLFSFIAFSRCHCPADSSKEDIQLLSLLADIIAANMEKNLIIKKLLARLTESGKKSALSGNSKFQE